LHPILKHLKKGAKHLAKGRRELLRAGELIVSLLKDLIPNLSCDLGNICEGVSPEVITFEVKNNDICVFISSDANEKYSSLDTIIQRVLDESGIKGIHFHSHILIPKGMAEEIEKRLRQVIQDGVDN